MQLRDANETFTFIRLQETLRIRDELEIILSLPFYI